MSKDERTRLQKIPRSAAVIGLGNWGSSLAHALLAAKFPLTEIVVHSSLAAARERRSGGWPPGTRITRLDAARLDADTIWLCVPDARIAALARVVAKRLRQDEARVAGQIVIHSSGARSSDILAPVARAGAAVASVHPMMSFPSRMPVSLRGTAFTVEADARTSRKLTALIRRLGGRSFSIGSSGKPLYHAAAMLASPFVVASLAAAQEAAVLAGLRPHEAQALIEPIARATMDNVFLHGAAKSFSGPIARGDLQTILLHLRALETHPKLAEFYRGLARYALDALPTRRRAALRRTLADFEP